MTRRAPFAVAVGLLLAGCSETKQDVFHPKGSNAEKINNLQVPVFIVAGVVGVLVAAALTYVIVTGKRRSSDEGEPDPEQIHGNFKWEIGWTIAPAIILALVAFPTVKVLLDVNHKPKDAMTIDVYGQQWWWSYEYDTNSDGTPDIITANELVLPAGVNVHLRIQSRDVIHSFWIPALNGTRDAVPGRVQPLEMRADQPGEYDGQCKEYCGLSHANMRARAVVLSQDDFAKWVASSEKPAATPAAGSQAAAGLDVFNTKCASCHQVDGVNEVEGKAALIAGHAPNLTHLMERKVFASAQFPLWLPGPDGKLTFNRNQLEAWLRDPPGLLPMAPDEKRGMPNLGLSESDIDKLIAYLSTLGPYPTDAVPPSGS
ncbi:MAG: cytochrome c oxidase subunit II [Acidimicrobiales bacterium]